MIQNDWHLERHGEERWRNSESVTLSGRSTVELTEDWRQVGSPDRNQEREKKKCLKHTDEDQTTAILLVLYYF